MLQFLSATKQIYTSGCPSVRPSGRPSVRSSGRPSVRLSGIFYYFPIIRISRNLQGILTLDTWISGHRSQGHPVKVKVTAREKLVVFGVFFILSRTRPTVFIGLCWYHIEMCRMAICKNVMRRNFDFFPQRSNIGVKSVVFWRFFIVSRTRPTIFIRWCWYRI